MGWGVNVDPGDDQNPPIPGTVPSADELGLYGCRWVRLVSRHGVEPFVVEMQARGIMVLACITEQSQGYLCPADVYQIGNEPDRPGHGDSFTPRQYVDYWNIYYGTWFASGKPYAGFPVIGAGLESGDLSYWQNVANLGGLRGAAGFAVHPYAKTATLAKGLLQGYQRITPSLPLWVTEWNRPSAEAVGFAAMLRQTAAMSAWFSWGYDWSAITPTVARMMGAVA